VGFYGGTEAALNGLTKRLSNDYASLTIAYAFSPPFRALAVDEKRRIADNILNSGCQILFVGLGCPKQERWMAEHVRELPVVMLGRDIAGVVFPHTPFKFFLDATEEVREQRHVKSTNARGAKKRDLYDQSRVIFMEDSLMIDTSKLEPGEVSGIILVEVIWRAGNSQQLKT
jgi:hypothetical protein